MAGINKTYIHGKDYPLYRQWWIDNYDKMIKELGNYIWLYTFNSFYPNEPDKFTPEFLLNNTQDLEEYKNVNDFLIWNTSEKQDKWLIKNCDIESFRNRMIQVYNYKWIGFKNQNWIPKPKLKTKFKK